MKSVTNRAASARRLLLNLAKKDGRPFSEILQYYAMERFLYRLFKSDHCEKFILKGALLMRVWHSSRMRPTMDIDILGKTENNEQALLAQVRDILSVHVVEDGLIYQPERIRTELITEDADYSGLRVRIPCLLDSARITLQLDIGFGDSVYPDPQMEELPTLLDLPSPRLLCYSRESVIAEKFEAMIKLGVLNSRMKDFYDIRLISHASEFKGPTLAEAVKRTFQRRETLIPETIESFGDDFIEKKQVQWEAFCGRIHQDFIPGDFREIVFEIREFLLPVVQSITSRRVFNLRWVPPGPWRR